MIFFYLKYISIYTLPDSDQYSINKLACFKIQLAMPSMSKSKYLKYISIQENSPDNLHNYQSESIESNLHLSWTNIIDPLIQKNLICFILHLRISFFKIFHCLLNVVWHRNYLQLPLPCHCGPYMMNWFLEKVHLLVSISKSRSFKIGQ